MTEIKRCTDTNEPIMSRKGYRDSKHWKLKKQEFRESSFFSGRCYHCKKPKGGMLFIHKHEENLGNENLEDILAVCPTCFKRYHSAVGEKTKTAAKVKPEKKPVATHKDLYIGKRRGDGSGWGAIMEEGAEEREKDIIF